MNLVGKIFVFLVFVMSLMFMTMAMMVFQNHKNWKDIVENTDTSDGKTLGLKKQLENEQDKSKDLTKQVEDLQKQINSEKARKAQALAAVESEKVQLQKKVFASEAKLAKSESEHAAMSVNMIAIAKIAKDMQVAVDGTEEVEGLRTQIAKALAIRDRLFVKTRDLIDVANQAQGDVSRLLEEKKTIENQLAQSNKTLVSHNIRPGQPGPNEPPPPLNGLIADVDKTGKWVEVTVGFDDGLRKNHTMEVFNQSGYLGRLRVISTKPDSAVGRMEILNRRIQRGDRVATKLNKVG